MSIRQDSTLLRLTWVVSESDTTSLEREDFSLLFWFLLSIADLFVVGFSKIVAFTISSSRISPSESIAESYFVDPTIVSASTMLSSLFSDFSLSLPLELKAELYNAKPSEVSATSSSIVSDFWMIVFNNLAIGDLYSEELFFVAIKLKSTSLQFSLIYKQYKLSSFPSSFK